MRRFQLNPIIIGLITLGYLFFFSSLSYGTFVEETDLYHIHFASENLTVTFDTPVIIYNKQQFFPVRDMVPFFEKASLIYLRKDDVYELSIKDLDHKSVIIPNSKKFEANGRTYTFTQPPFYYDNRLYVPLYEFFAFSGFLMKRDGTGFSLGRKAPGFHSSSKPDEVMLNDAPKHNDETTEIVSISEIREGRNIVVTIEGTAAFQYTLRHYDNPDRLVIDIPNATSKLPQINRSVIGPYAAIRSSLFKSDPPSTRIVFDLSSKQVEVDDVLDDHTLVLTFPAEREVVISVPETAHAVTKKVIVVDAGHGGSDPGALSDDNHHEKFYTLDIAKRLQKKLAEQGAYVIMTREDDSNPSLLARIRTANKNKADVLLSIHINSFFHSNAHGTETYYYKNNDRQLASSLQKSLVNALDHKNNGIKRARLYVLSQTDMPAALVEPVFITNQKEYNLLQKEAFRQKIADALFEGMTQYFRNKNQ